MYPWKNVFDLGLQIQHALGVVKFVYQMKFLWESVYYLQELSANFRVQVSRSKVRLTGNNVMPETKIFLKMADALSISTNGIRVNAVCLEEMSDLGVSTSNHW